MLRRLRKLKLILCIVGFAVLASGTSAVATVAQQASAMMAVAKSISESDAAATHSGGCHHGDDEPQSAPSDNCTANPFEYCISFAYISPSAAVFTVRRQSESFTVEGSSGRPRFIKPGVDPPRA